jgi:ribosomal protein S1
MNIKEGQIVEGEITRVVEEGAFVDIGTLREAVIPRMDLDKLDPIQLDQVREGENVKVRITHAPQNGANPFVSIAQVMQPEEGQVASDEEKLKEKEGWAIVEDAYQIGDHVEGTVTHIRKYGAFVKLPIGIEGLVHVSEMEPGFTSSPWDVVSEGDRVQVKVIKIEPERERIGLSLVKVLS